METITSYGWQGVVAFWFIIGVILAVIYKGWKQGRKVDGVVSEAYECESEKQKLQNRLDRTLKLLESCESANEKLVEVAEASDSRANSYQKSYMLQKQIRDEMAKKHNNCRCEMETVITGLDKILESKEGVASARVKIQIEKIKSILEV